jgi:alkylated DNA repair dioxygenase AlkB
VYYDPLFLTADEADRAYAELWQQTPWQTTAKINRWVCLMEDDRNQVEMAAEKEPEEETSDGKRAVPSSSPYRYRDAPDRGAGSSLPFTDLLRDLAQRASTWYEEKHRHDETKNADDGPSSSHRPLHFNVCLLNFYEDGMQRIGWHCDREEIGRTTPIAAISLGATRSFHLRSQNDGFRDRTVLSLTSGSLLIMENRCQTSYLHAVPREPHVTTGRINLTFRCKDETMDRTAGEEIHARRDEWLQSIVAGVEPDDNMYRTTGGPDAAVARQDDDTNNVVFGDTASTTMPPTRPDDDDAMPILPVIQFIVTTNLGAESYCAAELMELLQNDGDDDDDSARTMVVVARPLGLHGCVAVCCGASGGGHHQHDDDEEEESQAIIATVQCTLLQSRSAHHILRYHTHFSLNDLTDDTGYPLWKDVPAERLYAHVKAELEARRLHIFSTTVQAAAAGVDDVIAATAAMSFRVSCERMGGPHAFASHQVELYVFLSGLFLSVLIAFFYPRLSLSIAVVVWNTQKPNPPSYLHVCKRAQRNRRCHFRVLSSDLYAQDERL